MGMEKFVFRRLLHDLWRQCGLSGKMQRLREVDVEIKHMLALLYGPFVLQTHSNQGLQAKSGSSWVVPLSQL